MKLGEGASMAYWDLIEAVANWKAKEAAKAAALVQEEEKPRKKKHKGSVADEKANGAKSQQEATG